MYLTQKWGTIRFMPNHLIIFSRAFWSHWIEVTGGTVAFLVAAYLYLANKSSLGVGALVLVGLVCFFVASFKVWHKEYEENQIWSSKKPEITVQLTRVKWKPTQLGTGRKWPDSDGKSVYDVFIQAKLELREPAHVDVLRYRLHWTDGLTHHHPADHLDDLLDWELVVEDKNAGTEQESTLTPLPKKLGLRGEPVNGWVHFHFGRCRGADMNTGWFILEAVSTQGSNKGEIQAAWQHDHIHIKRKGSTQAKQRPAHLL